MTPGTLWQDRADDALRGRLTRRAFLHECARLGLSASAALAFLQACSRAERRAGHETGEDAELEDRLNIYNWSDYIGEKTIPRFEREFGVKVRYDTYESNEEMLAKLQAGAAGYDVIVPSDETVEVLIKLDLLLPLNREWTELEEPRPSLCRPAVRSGREAQRGVPLGHGGDRLPQRFRDPDGGLVGQSVGCDLPAEDHDAR